MSDVKTDSLIKENNPLVEEEKKEETPSVPYAQLYRYAGPVEWCLIVVGTVCCAINGFTWPALMLFFGKSTGAFTFFGRYQSCNQDYQLCYEKNLTTLNESTWNETILSRLDSFQDETLEQVYGFCIVGAVAFVTFAFQVGTWNLAAVRITEKIRLKYFHSLLRQDIGFHDLNSAGELNSRLSSDIKKIAKGVGDKVSMFIHGIVCGVISILFALTLSWKLSLVSMAFTPLVLGPMVFLFKVKDIYNKKELDAYAKAGAIAEEAISSIRTVVAFGCQHKEIEKYAANLKNATDVGVQRIVAQGGSLGLNYLTQYGMYGMCLWYGAKLVIEGELDSGEMILVFFLVLIAAYSISAGMTYTENLPEAQAAAAKIYQVIDRIPEIDIFSDDGEKPVFDHGEIVFSNVEFSYPSRESVDVLNDINFVVEHGKRIALVGQSGCGKSTIIQLIQRFYDVKSGSITIGGKDVKTLNVKLLRDLIGVVAQEPVLFATTIAENIRWGRDDVTDDEIHQAAKEANVYDFIMKLPQKFDTLVGNRGGQVSGGQKQRIAIARAIVRNPKILLLDEATSSLDSYSESKVQDALDKASAGRTTVVVAHRLSTIRNADKIIAIVDGKVIEQGSHDQLLQNPNGVYRNLVNMQASREHGKETNDNKDVEDSIVEDYSDLTETDFLVGEDEVIDKETPLLDQNDQEMVVIDPKIENNKKKAKKDKKKKDEKEEEEEDLPKFDFMRILKMNSPEWLYLVFGCIFALLSGSCDPLNAIIYAEIFKTFALADPEEQYARATVLGLLYAALGFICFVGFTAEGICFGKSGMKLTYRLRKSAFSSILRQDISYFDEKTHSSGALCSRLAEDANRVQGCTGITMGLVLKNLATLGLALGISFAFGWKMTLVIIGFVPLIALGSIIEMTVFSGFENDETVNFAQAGSIATEAITNIRTVASLTKEKHIYELYLQKIAGPAKKALWKSTVIGLAFGYSQCIVFFAFAAAFAVAGITIESGEMEFDKAFLVLVAIIFGTMAVGQNSAFAPDFAEAKIAATRMMALFDRVPAIDADSTEGKTPAHCKGQLTVKSVSFHYSTRPSVPVLKDLSVSVQPGQTLALVGQSGCGKSTTTYLMERFYDPIEGSLLLDGIDIKQLNVAWLRQQMGLVSQEPVLFDQSIKENILYGDCTRVASDKEIEEVASQANIDQFISDLPEGYNTNAGSKGSQLSGGQKQRIAIARALLRNPKILLLDEATSALDTENEKIVQEALDSARSGRTSIVIAHRLSTVKNADQIAVIDSGTVIEVGTHDELIAKKGAYYSLVNAQIFTNEGGIA
ncbi:unnamed protein product [Clavelina lepadiformis]|uniref:Uncharacterized protein n=1 Tax=Clavelina lepadiformis TaxID=159417 RepID=A0ABP0H538_CLALP